MRFAMRPNAKALCYWVLRAVSDKSREFQVRLNGLLRLDPVFDLMIAHPKVVPYLKAFMGEPQLINTWSISKFKGAQQGGMASRRANNGLQLSKRRYSLSNAQYRVFFNR